MKEKTSEKEIDKQIKYNVEWHDLLDIIIAEFINDTGNLPSKTNIMELMEWSHERKNK